jgi:hypothetical protein
MIETELAGKRLRDLALGRKLHAHEHRAKPLTGALLLAERVLQLLVSQDARVAKAFPKRRTHNDIVRLLRCDRR